MDGLLITFICVMVLVVILLIVSFVCHFFGPRAIAWFRSNREEKIGLSKSKIFNANGYMIHSGSDFLQLSSTGSFKRFDSIDRDYKQVGQSSISSPSWNIPQTDTNIPPQPLRPAPAPAPAIRQNTIKTKQLPQQQKIITKENSNQEINDVDNNYSPLKQHHQQEFVQQQQQQQIIDRIIKQKSLEQFEKTTSSSKSTSSPSINNSTSAIPRPVAKRQLSTPVENYLTSMKGSGIIIGNGTICNGDIPGKINISKIASKIQANNINNNNNNNNSNNNNNNNITNNEKMSNNTTSFTPSSPLTPTNLTSGKIISPKIRRQRLLMEHHQQQLQRISSNGSIGANNTNNSSTTVTTSSTNTNPFLNGNNFTVTEQDVDDDDDDDENKLKSLSSSITATTSTTTITTVTPIQEANIDNPINYENLKKNMKNIKTCDTTNEINLKYSTHNDLNTTFNKTNDIQCNNIDRNINLTYKNEINISNKNPFTADSILEYQRQRHKQANISSSEDAFDLLPELKEPPKTDLDRYTIFNFEPDNINTILTNQQQQQTPNKITIPSTTAIDNSTLKFDLNPDNNNKNKMDDNISTTATTVNSPRLYQTKKITNSLSSLNESLSSITPNSPRSFNSFDSSNNLFQIQEKITNDLQNSLTQHIQQYRNETTTINTAFNPLPITENLCKVQSLLSENDNDLNQIQSPNKIANNTTEQKRNFLFNRFDSNIEKIINQNLEYKPSNLYNYNSTSVPSLFNITNNHDNRNQMSETDVSMRTDFSNLSFWNNVDTISNYRNDNTLPATTSATKPSGILNFQRRASSAGQLFNFDRKIDLEKSTDQFRPLKSFKLYNGNSVGYQSPYYSLQKTLFTSSNSPPDKKPTPLKTSTSNSSIFDYSNSISQLSKYFGIPTPSATSFEKESGISLSNNQRLQLNHNSQTLDEQFRTNLNASINQNILESINSTNINQSPSFTTTNTNQQQIFDFKESNSENFSQYQKPLMFNIINTPNSPKTLSFQTTNTNQTPSYITNPTCPLYQSPSSSTNINSPKESDVNSGLLNNNSFLKKYLDSPCSDVFDDIEQMIRKRCRNRSHSETEATENEFKFFNRHSTFRRSLNTNPFMEKGTHMLHKTFSENFLAKGFNAAQQQQQQQQQQNYQTWCFGRTFSQQESLSFNLARRNSSQSSINDSERGVGSLDSLHHAISCESVNSVSSVLLSDLEPVQPAITGQLCVGLKYDKNSLNDDGIELNVNVMEAKELIGPGNSEPFDTFVRMYLVPDETGARQTKLFKNSSSPRYNETFNFSLDKNKGRRSLWFHLYHSGNSHSLIGETELQIADVSTARPFTTWLSLSDSRNLNLKWGELMFSLSYLPTAERLTVVVVKGRNFHFEQNTNELESQNIFVKVYLLKDNKKISKKKTTLKRKDRCPIFNESMIFSIPPFVLNTIQVRLTVMSISSDQQQLQQQQYQSLMLSQQQQQLQQQQPQQYCETLGHIFIGNCTTGKGVKHWNQMLSSLRKPVAMWHPLRKTKPKSIVILKDIT